jgi:hypothetical protein
MTDQEQSHQNYGRIMIAQHQRDQDAFVQVDRNPAVVWELGVLQLCGVIKVAQGYLALSQNLGRADLAHDAALVQKFAANALAVKVGVGL